MDSVGFLYGLGLSQGLIFATVLLVMRSDHRQANAIMAALVLTISFVLVQKWLSRSGFWVRHHEFALILPSLRFAWGPLLYFYAYSITGGNLRKIHMLHFAPMVMLFLVWNLTYWQMEPAQQFDLFKFLWGISPKEIDLTWLPTFWQVTVANEFHEILHTIHFGIYCALVIFLIRDHNKRLKEQFSSLEKRTLNWLYVVAASSLVYLATYVLSRPARHIIVEWIDVGSLAGINGIVLVCIIYGVAITAVFQPSLMRGKDGISGSFKEQDTRENESPGSDRKKYERSSINMEDAQRYQVRLMNVMKEHELYLDSDLTLPDLAKAARMTPQQVSQVINGHLSMNFYSFVNDYRLKLVQRLLSDPETCDMPIVELAIEAGFKSKSSFYDAFKRSTGMTPVQFKKMNNTT